jgi:hypothetical protein
MSDELSDDLLTNYIYREGRDEHGGRDEGRNLAQPGVEHGTMSYKRGVITAMPGPHILNKLLFNRDAFNEGFYLFFYSDPRAFGTVP